MSRSPFKQLLAGLALSACAAVHAGSYEDFFQAVQIDNGSAVAALLQRGFDPNTRDPKGQTGLTLAMRDQSPRVGRALLDSKDLDINAANASGETALMLAALKGDLEWTQRLLERGAAVNRSGWSPLHYAASGQEVKIVALLLDRGADIEARSPNGTTPLMMAARYGNEAIVDLLLQRGANSHQLNDRQLGMADFARLAGREALTRRLEPLQRQ